MTAMAAAAGFQRAASSKTIVGVAASDPQFTTLVALVKKAGLVGASLRQGPLTVRPDRRRLRQGAEGGARRPR